MKYYFITGTSQGIGKALALSLLEEADTKVIGTARHQTIEHRNYTHVLLDLNLVSSLIDSVPNLFPELPDATELVLVNNAGIIGQIGYVGEKQAEDFNAVFSVNVTAPAILMNAFLERYGNVRVPKIIMNISSGAGKYPLDGWAAYCASKAALDLFSQTVQEEQNLRNSGVKIFSVAPGIVDTPMQAQIRKAGPDQFSNYQKFQDYKAEGNLASPETVAQKLKNLLLNPPANLPVVTRIE